MTTTSAATLQTIWDCKWSRPGYRLIGVEDHLHVRKHLPGTGRAAVSPASRWGAGAQRDQLDLFAPPAGVRSEEREVLDTLESQIRTTRRCGGGYFARQGLDRRDFDRGRPAGFKAAAADIDIFYGGQGHAQGQGVVGPGQRPRPGGRRRARRDRGCRG